MPAPVITSALTALTVAGESFTYNITASNTPTSYAATGLPAGLSVNTGTGAITGNATGPEVYSVTISAINGSGTGTAVLQLTVVSNADSDADQSGTLHKLQAEPETRLLARMILSGIRIASEAGASRALTGAALTSSGTFAAGARNVTFIASSDFSGTLLGQPFAAGASVSFRAPGNDTLGAIAYTRSAGTLYAFYL